METWRRQSCLRLQRSRSKLSLMGRLAAASPSAGRQDCLRHEKDGGDRFRIAAVLPSLPKIGTVIPASRREALYGRSSYLDVPSEWHRASSAGPD